MLRGRDDAEWQRRGAEGWQHGRAPRQVHWPCTPLGHTPALDVGYQGSLIEPLVFVESEGRASVLLKA